MGVGLAQGWPCEASTGRGGPAAGSGALISPTTRFLRLSALRAYRCAPAVKLSGPPGGKTTMGCAPAMAPAVRLAMAAGGKCRPSPSARMSPLRLVKGGGLGRIAQGEVGGGADRRLFPFSRQRFQTVARRARGKYLPYPAGGCTQANPAPTDAHLNTVVLSGTKPVTGPCPGASARENETWKKSYF